MSCENAVRYQGPAIERIAGADLSGHRAIAIIGNRAIYADNRTRSHADASHCVSVGAVMLGQLGCFQVDGPLAEPSWNWTPNLPIFIGQQGILTQIAPVAPAANWSKIIAFAMSETEILLAQEPAIILE